MRRDNFFHVLVNNKVIDYFSVLNLDIIQMREF
jgi:hypothetical protein